MTDVDVSSREFWADQLNEAEAQLAEMTGSPSFSIAGMNVDEKGLHETLVAQCARCKFQINQIDSGASALYNSRNTAAEGGGTY